MTILLVDNLSPFTPDISSVLKRLDADFAMLKYSEIDEQALSAAHAFILSGRRSGSPDTNSINARIIRHCKKQAKSLLGICYGAEILALSLGGSIKRLPSKIVGAEVVKISAESDLTAGLGESVSVFEAHGLAIARLPEGFVSLAHSSRCEHEIISSSDGRLWGTQFHPEKSGSAGSGIIANFVKISSQR